MKTITQVRNQFWLDHPELKPQYRATYRQNDYPTDVRVAFVDYVDYLHKEGQISSKLANRVTL